MLKSSLAQNNLLESLKERAFINELQGPIISIASLTLITPKTAAEILETHQYISLSESYISKRKLEIDIQQINNVIHNKGFIDPFLKLSDFKQVLKIAGLKLVANQTHFFDPFFYKHLCLLMDYAQFLHQLDPIQMLNKRDIPLQIDKNKIKGNALATLAKHYLIEIMDMQEEELAKTLLKGLHKDYLLPLLKQENLKNYNELLVLVDKNELNVKDLKDIVEELNKSNVLMTRDEFRGYTKALLYCQWDVVGLTDVTLFHLYLNWFLIKQGKYVYIRGIDIPEIVTFVDQDIKEKCRDLITKGHLTDKQDLKINYFD